MGWLDLFIGLFIVLSIVKKVRDFNQKRQPAPQARSAPADEPAPMAAPDRGVIIPPPIDERNYAEQFAIYTKSAETDQT